MSTIKVTNLRHESATGDNITLTSTDRVGIGEASPNRQLVINGGASEGVIQITNDTSGTAVANGFELIHFTNGETQLLNRENVAMRFDTNGTERIRILSSGGLTFNGDTAAANALDDYEEGTWTVGTVGISGTFVSRNNFYVKVGKIVTCWFDLFSTSQNLAWSGGHAAYITGFPFGSEGSQVTAGSVVRIDSAINSFNVEHYFAGSTTAGSNQLKFETGASSHGHLAGSITYRTST